MGQHTLLHGEALFVIASTDTAGNIHTIQVVITYLPLITQRVCSHFCGHALLIEDPQFPVAGNDFLAWNFHVIARIRFAV
uniref:Uncharacterized protein n=1 Tax=Sinocyclocheilus rhinocerous TaxID=307959 RepID=A0A673G4C5_9TELE